MREILITTDPVLLSFVKSVLADAGVETMVADQYTSSIEGSVGVLPRRLLVHEDLWATGRQALTEAGLADQMVADADPSDSGGGRS